MKFASTRLIAADIKGMVSFYEMVTGLKAEWLAPVFAEIVTPAGTLAIGSVETVGLWKEGPSPAQTAPPVSNSRSRTSTPTSSGLRARFRSFTT